MNKIAVISFSGGMDSTSLLLHLISNDYRVYALSYNYGQKHKLELEKAKENIQYLASKDIDVHHKIINLSDCIDILSSSLTDKTKKIPTGYYKQENMVDTFVPNRNAIFSSILYGYALTLCKKNDDNEILLSLGVHAGDHAIYPDCRKEFHISLFDSFKIGNWDSDNIKLYLPYINFSKSEILMDAERSIHILKLDFNKIFSNTLTSYEPDALGRSSGKTGSDIERILAFHSLGKKDPIEYIDSWNDVVNNAIKIEEEFKSK